MARKSKGKFNMKGHSIPGIKGCKTTTLEDGRAASSAFQMQSPLHEESKLGDTELSWDDIEKQEYTANRASSQAVGQSGVDYGMQELIKARNRLKAKKDNEENPSDKIDDTIEENLPEVNTIEDPEIVDPLADDVKMADLSVPEINKPDYSEATKNEMYDLRRPFKDDGSWDPKGNPEHAEIQNKINELHGADKRY